jgi:hypothetical protein
MPAAVLDAMVGWYRSDDFDLEISRAGSGLRIALSEGRIQPLIPISETEFALGVTAATVTATIGVGGRPSKLTFRMAGSVYDLLPATPPAH